MSTIINDWTETGSLFTGEDIGGDTQAGESYSRRFISSGQAPEAVVDVTFYPVGPSCNGRPLICPRPAFAVQRAITYRLCDDVTRPGDTEWWEDCVYEDEDDLYPCPDSQADAEQLSAQLAAAFDPAELCWDGAAN